MALFIDVHSHLDHHLLVNQLDEVIRRAKNAGVRHIITNGINPETNRKCLEISKKYDIVECGMGLYPRNALKKDIDSGDYPIKLWDYDVDEELEFIKQNKNNIVAISEVGLDFVDGESKQQMEDFEKAMKLAEQIGKPIVVHSRKAEQKCIKMIESSKLKRVVMHCFCGKKSLVKRIADNGWYITIPTSVVRAQQFQDIVKNVPITQLFCETDSPYLSPYKDKMNEPAFILESYNKISEIKKMDPLEVANSIYMNWQKVFK
ncbi:MAG TPA: TatD family hydrolase [Candidatus Nanoarchaeia archaeon]|nr:TatD family hydrolase [Candidatus Nanoarchaeia archaeon]